jgi:hypothetical protein
MSHKVSYKWIRKTQLYHHLVEFTRTGDFTWRVSDCEVLSGGYLETV